MAELAQFDTIQKIRTFEKSEGITVPKMSVRDIIQANPCEEYPAAKIRELAGSREWITIRDVMHLDIPTHDKLWIILRPPWMHDDQLMILAREFRRDIRASMLIHKDVDEAYKLACRAGQARITDAHLIHNDARVRERLESMCPGTKAAMYSSLWTALAVARFAKHEKQDPKIAGDRARMRHYWMACVEILAGD